MNLLWMNKKENNNFIDELNSFYQFEKTLKKRNKTQIDNNEKTLIFFEQIKNIL